MVAGAGCDTRWAPTTTAGRNKLFIKIGEFKVLGNGCGSRI